MALKHTKVSAKADGTDSTLVQPSDWNSAHLVDGTDLAGVALAPGAVSPMAVTIGARAHLGWKDPAGNMYAAQAHLGRNGISAYFPRPTCDAITAHNSRADASGTGTPRTLSQASVFRRMRRYGYVSAVGAGSVCGLRSATKPYLRAGGLSAVFRFGVSDDVLVAGARMFVGFALTNGAFTDVDPSTRADVFGVGCDAGDTTLQLYAAASVAQARTSLGANFPINTIETDVYEFSVSIEPATPEVIDWRVRRLNTGDATSGQITDVARVINQTTGATFTNHFWRSNGADANAVGLDVFGFYAETE